MILPFKPRLFHILWLIIFLALFSGVSYARPQAHKGVIDLSEYDFNKDGIIKLRGEWEFYWKEFIDPVITYGPLPTYSYQDYFLWEINSFRKERGMRQEPDLDLYSVRNS